MAKQTLLDHWSNRAKNSFVGRRIVDARYLSKEELETLGWTKSVLVFQLDDGTLLFPSQDDEGNDGGAMFGEQGGNSLTFPRIDERSLDRQAPTILVPENAAPRPPRPARTGPTPQDPRSERTNGTLRRLLKKIQGGKTELHFNNERSLLQLKEQGYIARMAKTVRGRVPYFKVELTEEGKAA